MTARSRKPPLKHTALRILIALPAVLGATALAAEAPSGNAVIRAPAGASEIVITTTARLAGAIHSLTWNGREFIDSHDHGRQLQSASNLDCGTPITNETFNPTEAGSRRDGRGQRTTSRLLRWRVEPAAIETTTQMAFWLAPGEKSGPNRAKNSTVVSEHLLTKRVRIGYQDLPQVIAYDVTFTLPPGEQHTHAVFEALTGYMPPAFADFWQFDSRSSKLEPLSAGPGEIPQPIVFSVAGGSHAMGIYAPPQAPPNTRGPTYGRFRFHAENVVKWNCVFRVTNQAGLAPGDYTYRMFVCVGDLATVRDLLAKLANRGSPSGKQAGVRLPNGTYRPVSDAGPRTPPG